MSFEADLITYVSGIAGVTAVVGNRTYPNVNNDATITYPYLCISIDKERNSTLNGKVATVKAKVYFDAYSTAYADTVNATAAVVNALHGYKGTMGSTAIVSSLIPSESDKPVPPPDGSNRWIFHREAEADVIYAEQPPLTTFNRHVSRFNN